jgi:hypothetical protein
MFHSEFPSFAQENSTGENLDFCLYDLPPHVEIFFEGKSMKPLLFCLFFSIGISAHAAPEGATVILIRGTVKTSDGKVLALKDTVKPGTTVKTEAKSFVKLLFADQSSMNVGPDTTLKIESTKPGDPSLVNLVGGQIRAKVTKDLLKGNEEKEKLLIKTKTAAMGIRGTDFTVSFNNRNQVTTLITFEGSVAMIKADPTESPMAALARAGDNVQMVGAGQFSGAQPDRDQASIPVKISPAQMESLKGNENFTGLGEKSNDKPASMASPIPPGVDPKNFSSGAEKSLQSSLGNLAGNAGDSRPTDSSAAGGPPPEGFYNAKTGEYAPRAGGFIDLATGLYLPPPPGSTFDANTGVFVPPKAAGEFNPATGMYVPPRGVELDPVKGFVAERTAGGFNDSSAPPPAAMALINALNFSTSPELAGQTATFTPLFSPTVDGDMMPPPPPPLPGALPPPPPGGMLPPPPEEPIDDPTCTTCLLDNILQTPTNTNVQFNLTVDEI